MANDYSTLSREQLLALLARREAETRYGLVWERDDIAPDAALNDDFVAVSPAPTLHCGAAPWHNLIIEGDNYDALRFLRMTHSRAIKCIYIDPPYNTGNRDFVYNDRYFDKSDRFRHSTWLEFMYQRLCLARDLLADDGVIFVSIDDNELFPLGMLMNQVFGEQHFVANCIWQKRYSRENRESIGDAHEYLLVYASDPGKFKLRRGKLPLEEKQLKLFKNPDNDSRGKWQSVSLTAQGFRPNQMYRITAPNGNEHCPPEGTCWKVVESEYQKLLADNRIYFGANGEGVPRRKMFLSDTEGLVPWTWWPHDEVGHTDEARKEIQEIFGTQTAFDTPKPVRLIERILRIACGPQDTVLDFFAGSGTTAQAVLKLNAEDCGTRRFILVSSREATVDAPEKNLCRDVCAERVRRVAQGYTNRSGAAVAGLGGGFAYLVASRLPRHRLDATLQHEQAWLALQLLHGHPLQPAPASGGLWVSRKTDDSGGHTLVYVRHTRRDALNALRELAATLGVGDVLYSWAADKIAETLPALGVRPLPDALQKAFARANRARRKPSTSAGKPV